MVHLCTFASLAYLSQVVFLGGNAQTNSSQLVNIVPKREVLYVGGQYTNITASFRFNKLTAHLTPKAEQCNQFHLIGYDRPNLRREAFSQPSPNKPTTAHNLYRRRGSDRNQFSGYSRRTARMGSLFSLQRSYSISVRSACARSFLLVSRTGTDGVPWAPQWAL